MGNYYLERYILFYVYYKKMLDIIYLKIRNNFCKYYQKNIFKSSKNEMKFFS